MIVGAVFALIVLSPELICRVGHHCLHFGVLANHFLMEVLKGIPALISFSGGMVTKAPKGRERSLHILI